MKERVFVLGGTTDHIRLINILKNKGYFVILIDYLDNPPAKEDADLFLQISILDKEEVLRQAEINNISNIFTTSIEQALLTASYVCEKLNLSFYINYSTAQILTNKSLMKKMMFDNQIPTSNYISFRNLEEIELNNIKYPSIIKPVDANSSKGVIKVNSKEDLINSFQQSLSFSTIKEVILEDFVEGIELSIDAFILNEDVNLCMITENIKSKFNDDNFTIIESFYDRYLEHRLNDKVLEIVKKISTSINLKNGPLLIQAIYNKESEKVSIIEFSSRLGGGSKNFYLNKVKGIDLQQKIVDLTLKESISIDLKDLNYEYAMMKYLYIDPGSIYKYEGFNELIESYIIEDYFIYKSIGSTVDNFIKSTDRVAGLFFSSSNLSDLNLKKHSILNSIKVVNSKGINLLKNI